MNPFFDFVQKNHILALIENAQIKKSHNLQLSRFEIDEFPTSILNCHELLRLYLQCNKLTVLPQLDQLMNLNTLALDSNVLTEFPVQVKRLKSLKNLNVSHNPIKEIPPDICEIIKLEVFWCNSCDLKALPKELGFLENLETFGARNNAITCLPDEFSYLQKLRWLSLENNHIAFLPKGFRELQSLTHLNLGLNKFAEIPNDIVHLKSLKFVILKENFVTYLNYNILEAMKHVTKIDLINNPIAPSHEEQIGCNFINLATNSRQWEPQLDVDNESDSTSEDWEESLDSSELDLTSSDTENEDGNEVLALLLPSLSRFLSPT